MTGIIYAVVVVGGVGLFIGLFLGIAAIKFKVEIDEKEEAVLAVLPGNNCGGCGFPGCSGLAAIQALADTANLSEETVEEVLSGQITEPLKVPSCRAKLLQALASPKSLQQINKSVIFNYKLKRKIARMLKKEFI